MTDKARLSVTLTPEIEEAVLKLKRRKEYCDKPKAYLLRRLIEIGLKSTEKL